MRTLIKLGLIIVVVLVGYNYFFGTSSEKSESQIIVEQVKDLGKSIGSLLKSEKEKFQQGKFDDFFDKLKHTVDNFKSKIDKADDKSQDAIERIEEKSQQLERKWKNSDNLNLSEKEKDELNREMEELMKQMEDLVKQLEEQ